MANDVEVLIVEEGPRNAVVRVAGVIDTANINLVSIIKPSMFTNNDSRMTLTGFRVDAILYSIGQVLDILVAWNGSVPQLIMPLARSGKIDATGDGGFLPDTTRAGYDGSINISSTGFPPGTTQNFTLLLRLVKLYRV